MRQKSEARLDGKDVQIVVPKDHVLSGVAVKKKSQVESKLTAISSLQLSPRSVLEHLVTKPALKSDDNHRSLASEFNDALKGG